MKNERDIFLQAIELLDKRRQASFLDDACGSNAELRANVEELILANSKASEFLETPPPALALTLRPEDGLNERTDSVSLDFLSPSDKAGCLGTLSCYEVVDVVGRGAFGIVLRAYDTKLSRVVAIKVMSPELATNPMAVKRFLREAQAAAAVQDDHVVTIHAVDETSSPPFIVMEFVRGESLREKLERDGALELSEILRIGKQMAAGLAAAHQQGLVHRDIKPSNILLENGIERVKITDFGLARAVDDVGMTQTGIIAGTPQYMSPEQGLGKPVDARSDLFSLGAVLYAICTGRPAFQADSVVATLRQVCDDEPSNIQEINPEIPEWLNDLVMHLLAKAPDDRVQSAEEVNATFCSCLAHLQSDGVTPLPHSMGIRRSLRQSWNPLLSFLVWAQLLGTLFSAVYTLSNSGAGGEILALFAFGLGLPITVMASKAKAGWTVIGYGLFWPGFFVLLFSLAALLRLDRLEHLQLALVTGLLLGTTWGIYALWRMVPGWRPKRDSFLWPTERRYWLLHITQCLVLSGGLTASLVEPTAIIPTAIVALVMGIPLALYASWMCRGGKVFLFAIAGPILSFFCFIAASNVRSIERYMLEPTGVLMVRVLIPLVTVALFFGLIEIHRGLTGRFFKADRADETALKQRLFLTAIAALVLIAARPFLSFSGAAYVAGSIFLGTLAYLSVALLLYSSKSSIHHRRHSSVVAVAFVCVLSTVSFASYQHEKVTRESHIYFDLTKGPSWMQIEIVPIGWQMPEHQRNVNIRRGEPGFAATNKGEFEINVVQPEGFKAVPARLNPRPRVLTRVQIVKN